MSKEISLKTVDLISYLNLNTEVLDEWTKKFLVDVQESLENNLLISKKQYQVLIKKAKDVYIGKNIQDFENAINIKA